MRGTVLPQNQPHMKGDTSHNRPYNFSRPQNTPGTYAAMPMPLCMPRRTARPVENEIR